jgi:predicted TIM-barrel fold metal-dependent hydrolase
MMRFLLFHGSLRWIGKQFAGQFTEDGSLKILMGTFKIYPDPSNAQVFDAIKKHPGKFYGWVFVNPRGRKDPLKEIDEWSKSPGFVGIKAHPFWHQYPVKDLVPAAERAARLDKPLIIHAGFGDHGNIMPLVDAVPGLKLIMAHTAFPCYRDSWKAIRNRKNIYVDLSQTSYVSEKITRDAVEYLGADRCMYGTDGPYGPHGADGLYDYGIIKRRIDKLFPEPKTRRLLLGENFARIAGI